MLISRVLLSSPPTRSLASCILRCLLRNSIGFLPGNRRLRKYLPIVSERFKAFLARSSSCRNKRRRRCFNNWGRLVDFPEYLKSVTVVFRLLQLFRIARDLRCPKRFWVLGFSSKSIKPLPQYTILACPIKAAITSSPGGGGVLPMMACTGRFLPGRGTFFRLQVCERVGISLVEVYKREGKSVIWVCKRAQKG